jgi:hypothetical protein
MSIFSVWPYLVLMIAAWLVLRAPVFRVADEPLQRDRRTATLDGLRGFLALSVFAHHLVITHRYIETGIWGLPPSALYTMLGQAGVMLFFMITGFLFWGKLLDAKGRPDWTALYLGRVFRIGPMYLLAVGLMLAIVAWRTGFALREPAWTVAAAVLQWLAPPGGPPGPGPCASPAAASCSAWPSWRSRLGRPTCPSPTPRRRCWSASWPPSSPPSSPAWWRPAWCGALPGRACRTGRPRCSLWPAWARCSWPSTT